MTHKCGDTKIFCTCRGKEDLELLLLTIYMITDDWKIVTYIKET